MGRRRKKAERKRHLSHATRHLPLATWRLQYSGTLPMPGEQSIASGACEATPKLALPPALPPSLSLCSVSLCLGINCGLLKCFLIEIIPNFTLGDQVQPVRSLCYANTLTLWRPAPSRREEGVKALPTITNREVFACLAKMLEHSSNNKESAQEPREKQRKK